jgi:anti-anti-sigma factor
VKPSHELHVERVVDPKGAHVVYRLSGALGETQASYGFLEEIRRDVATLPPKIVLNLQRVERMTSPGVGVIAACYTSAHNAGKELLLAAVSKVHLRVLEVAGLTAVIPVRGSEAEAVAAS